MLRLATVGLTVGGGLVLLLGGTCVYWGWGEVLRVEVTKEIVYKI